MVTDLVQPIAVRRSGSHEEVVLAVARASVLAFHHSADQPEWAEWLAGRFTKTVRRGTNSQVEAVAPGAAVEVAVGEARAYGLVPVSYDDMDPLLRRMQVGSFERGRAGWPTLGQGPILALSPLVPMTTGKTAAQAAHGLFAWYLTQGEQEREAWVAQGSPFDVMEPAGRHFLAAAPRASIRIEDAGLTEIARGSLTVLVFNPGAGFA